ncbi:MAG TPA: methionyl-tRNA formyltransferase [Gallionellaceae bacterium]|nr:methionyl-tRNA formyltransferase [Gallionellaceae bacterium]
MKIIFAGTPHFAAAALQALLARKFDIVAVLTQPDRPAGRGMKLQPSPVKQLAQQHGLPVLQPPTLKDAAIQAELAAYGADVMVVAAYGLILPRAALGLPRHGCLNIHASLLPRWRGAAPVQRAILAGDAETGITIMQMDEGLDTGDMLLKKAVAIGPGDTAQTLLDRLSITGGEAIVEALDLLADGKLRPTPQDNAQATYAAKLNKAEAQIDWTQDAQQIARAVRAYNPFPAAATHIGGVPVKIWQARVVPGANGTPGVIVSANEDGIVVACGEGALSLEVLQRSNAKAMPAAQFIRGFAVAPGDRCTAAA